MEEYKMRERIISEKKRIKSDSSDKSRSIVFYSASIASEQWCDWHIFKQKRIYISREKLYI